MSQPTTQMVFCREDSPAKATVSLYADGMANITVENTEVPTHACDVELTLGQMIGLRDFLNRGIDGLALAQAGSLAVRSSDDPTQMAAVEEVRPPCVPEPPACTGTVESLGGVYGCGQFSPLTRALVICPSCCEKRERIRQSNHSVRGNRIYE